MISIIISTIIAIAIFAGLLESENIFLSELRGWERRNTDFKEYQTSKWVDKYKF